MPCGAPSFFYVVSKALDLELQRLFLIARNTSPPLFCDPRTHMDVFGRFFPASFRNWWSDDWISNVYGREHTLR